MFSNSPKKSSAVTLIARNTAISGTVQFDGIINVEGTIKGDIVAGDGHGSEVAVLEHGVVQGQIRAPRVVVNGHVNGDIYADHLFVAAKAVIDGSLHYRLIEMEKGAQISGSMVHEASMNTSDLPRRLHPPSRVTETIDAQTAVAAGAD